MSIQRNTSLPTTLQRLLQGVLILIILVPGLSACDSFDPQVDAQDEALYSVASGTSQGLNAQSHVPLSTSIIDGSWSPVSGEAGWVQFGTEQVEQTKKGPRHKGRFTGQTECSDFSGKFNVRDGEVVTKSIMVESVRCQPVVEEALIAGLRAAAGYAFDHEVLHLMGAETPLVLMPRTCDQDDGCPDEEEGQEDCSEGRDTCEPPADEDGGDEEDEGSEEECESDQDGDCEDGSEDEGDEEDGGDEEGDESGEGDCNDGRDTCDPPSEEDGGDDEGGDEGSEEECESDQDGDCEDDNEEAGEEEDGGDEGSDEGEGDGGCDNGRDTCDPPAGDEDDGDDGDDGSDESGEEECESDQDGDCESGGDEDGDDQDGSGSGENDGRN